MRRLTTSLLALGVTLSLWGCPTRYARPDDYSPDPERLLHAIASRAESVKSLTAELHLEVWRGSERVRIEQMIALRQPDRLRIDSLSPFGQPLSTLVSDGAALSIYDLGAKRFFTGAASPKNLARLLPVALDPQELSAFLRGGVPTGRHDEASVSWDDSTGHYLLDLRRAEARQQVRFEPKSLRVVGVSAWRGDTLRYTARFGDFTSEGPEALPRRVRLEAPSEELRVDLKVVGHQLNPDLPDEAFVLEPPRGIPVEPLEG